MTRTMAHISDLHIGRDPQTSEAAAAIARDLVGAGVDDVLLTGDVTDRGRSGELATFERAFAPLSSRLVVVPGNHDRLGDDAAQALMAGPRVQVEVRPGLFVVRLDSTAPHNRRLIDSHGELTPRTIADVEQAVARAPPDALVVLMLHHHLLPLPADHLGERLASLLGWPELVLLPRSGRALHVLNAGSTPDLRRVRLVTHDAGRIVSQRWLELDGLPARRTSTVIGLRRRDPRAATATA